MYPYYTVALRLCLTVQSVCTATRPQSTCRLWTSEHKNRLDVVMAVVLSRHMHVLSMLLSKEASTVGELTKKAQRRFPFISSLREISSFLIMFLSAGHQSPMTDPRTGIYLSLLRFIVHLLKGVVLEYCLADDSTHSHLSLSNLWWYWTHYSILKALERSTHS
jgi:hypothetical protein